MISTKLKMSIVGAGIWGENHAKIYQAHPFCEVVAVCDEKPGKAKAMAEKRGIPKSYENYEEMFRESGCDAEAIVTPNSRFCPREGGNCRSEPEEACACGKTAGYHQRRRVCHDRGVCKE